MNKKNRSKSLLLLLLPFTLLPSSFCLSGCASVTNPVGHGVPVRRVPEELLCTSRKAWQPLPLQFLRRPVPPEYLLAGGDVLAVYVEGILPPPAAPLGQALPVNLPPLLQDRAQRR